MSYDVIIIGGGAAGSFASIIAAEQGKSVLLIEKNEKIGKKLYITGKGRCNITNDCSPSEFILSVVSNPKFLMGAINTFPPEKTIEFFEDSGCQIKIERGNRAFPASDKSSDIISALVGRQNELGVCVRLGEKVLTIAKNEDTFTIKTDKGEYFSTSVIVATGGLSYPLTGSTGDGYGFAKSLGHSVRDCVPALCPINLSGAFDVSGNLIQASKLHFPEGLSLKNVELSAYSGEKQLCSEFGEMLFTDRGISGPIVLTISSLINRVPTHGLFVSLDLKPSLSEEELDARILRDFAAFTNKQFKNALDDLLPKSMIPYVLALSGIPLEKKVNVITKIERTALVKLLKELKFKVSGLGKMEEAIITSGGVKVNEISPKTMESKLVKGLFFVGEVLDLDAFTGGYNLQIALSTAYLAGINA